MLVWNSDASLYPRNFATVHLNGSLKGQVGHYYSKEDICADLNRQGFVKEIEYAF